MHFSSVQSDELAIKAEMEEEIATETRSEAEDVLESVRTLYSFVRRTDANCRPEYLSF